MASERYRDSPKAASHDSGENVAKVNASEPWPNEPLDADQATRYAAFQRVIGNVSRSR